MLNRILVALAWLLAWAVLVVFLRAAIHWADVQSSHSPQEDMWYRLIHVLWVFLAATLVIPLWFGWQAVRSRMLSK